MSVLTYLFVAKFMFAVLRIAKVDFRRFISRILSKLNGYLHCTCILLVYTLLVYFLLIFHTMKSISALKATSEAIISDDSFYVTFRRAQQLDMTVTMSAI